MRFAFFSRTDTEVRMRILEGRRTRLAGAARPGPAAAADPPATDRYVSELQRHSIESVERELRWLTDLIEAERAGAPGQPLQPRPASHRSKPASRAPPARRTRPQSSPANKKEKPWDRFA